MVRCGVGLSGAAGCASVTAVRRPSLLAPTPRRPAALALVLARRSCGVAALCRAVVSLRARRLRTGTFSDPRVAELGVYLARDVVPWNVALVPRELAQVTAWLDAVKHAYHITPFITFQHADNNDIGPSPAQFLKAFLKFRKLFPWVNEFSPWDEATHVTQPTEHHPWLAAEYYNVLAAHCPGCEVTAPDILDSDGNVEAWVGSFLEKAHPYPKIWPFNPYNSVSTDNPRADRRVPGSGPRTGVVQRGRGGRLVAFQRQADRPRRSVCGEGRQEHLQSRTS